MVEMEILPLLAEGWFAVVRLAVVAEERKLERQEELVEMEVILEVLVAEVVVEYPRKPIQEQVAQGLLVK
jgi:hypothetical protein